MEGLILCTGGFWRRLLWPHLPVEMVKLDRPEWPNKVFKTPLVTEVYRCPLCGNLETFGDWPGPY
jgi:hypothetical protein